MFDHVIVSFFCFVQFGSNTDFNLMVTKEYVRNKIIIFGLFKIVALVLGSENADWMEIEDEDDSWMESNDDTLFEGDIMLVGAGQQARAGNKCPRRFYNHGEGPSSC